MRIGKRAAKVGSHRPALAPMRACYYGPTATRGAAYKPHICGRRASGGGAVGERGGVGGLERLRSAAHVATALSGKREARLESRKLRGGLGVLRFLRMRTLCEALLRPA